VGKAFNHGEKNISLSPAYSLRVFLNSRELRDVVEIPVAGVKSKVVLHHECGDPHLIRRDRRPLFPQLAIQCTVMMRRLVVSEEHLHPLLEQKVPEHALILRLAIAVGESGSKLGKDDKGQHHEFRFCEKSHSFYDTPAEIDISIRVESDPHFQRSSSIRR
jgi:hypothetical protein